MASFLDDLDVVANNSDNNEMKKQQSRDMLSSSDDDVRDGNGETADDGRFSARRLKALHILSFETGFAFTEKKVLYKRQAELLKRASSLYKLFKRLARTV